MELIIIIILIISLIILFSFSKSSKPNIPKGLDDNLSEKSTSKTVQFDLSVEDSISQIPKYFIFDCETTGLPKSRYSDVTDFANWPFIVQIAWGLFDEDGKAVSFHNHILLQKVKIPVEASNIHGITNQRMRIEGEPIKDILQLLIQDISRVDVIVSHNIDFDLPILQCELLRNGFRNIAANCYKICTMRSSMEFCNLYRANGSLKFPKLSETIGCLFFNDPYITFNDAHNAYYDLLMTVKAFCKLKKIGHLFMMASDNMAKNMELYHTDSGQDIDIPLKPDFGRVKQNHISEPSLIAEYSVGRRQFNNYWTMLYGNKNKRPTIFGEFRNVIEFNMNQCEIRLKDSIKKIENFM